MSQPPKRKSPLQWTCLVLSAVVLTLTFLPLQSMAEPEDTSFFSAQWGGHLRAIGAVSWIGDESLFATQDSGPYWDGQGELRLKSDLFMGKRLRLETHYELVDHTGDTLEARNGLGLSSTSGILGLLIGQEVNDDRRLMNLTRILDEGDRHVAYHRLDRFNLTYSSSRGTLHLGRQALTWGNGLIFNPMDLFNPFGPTQIDRDYKVGDDMAAAQLAIPNLGDFQGLYVPRRDPDNNDVRWDQSALAGKLHFAAATTEFDVMLAKNYDDLVGGLGMAGYLGEAAWRLDATWTYVNENNYEGRDDFFSVVANMDYSWVWGRKNFYGFIEYYYNGLGQDNYQKAVVDPEITERLLRGNLFVLGKNFLSSQLQVELHPLFNVYFTSINNVEDPSGVLQPRAIWDVRQNLQLTFGANIYWGDKGSEYGGFIIPGTNLRSKTPDNVYVWLTYYF